MNHESEFQPIVKASPARQAAEELAAAYARLFVGTEDGRRVLADLRAKFGLQRLCFHRAEGGRFDTVLAAITDGERRVMSEIEKAIERGTPKH